MSTSKSLNKVTCDREVEVIKSKIASGQPPSSSLLEKLEVITKDPRFIENEGVRKLA